MSGSPGAPLAQSDDANVVAQATTDDYIGKKRVWYDKVIISTVPHFCPVVFLLCPEPLYVVYATFIVISCALSIAWHAAGESKGLLMTFDYLFAALVPLMEFLAWALYFRDVLDIWRIAVIVCLNLAILASNKVVDKYGVGPDRLFEYDAGHSIWHLFSAAKVTFCAWLVGCSLAE